MYSQVIHLPVWSKGAICLHSFESSVVSEVIVGNLHSSLEQNHNRMHVKIFEDSLTCIRRSVLNFIYWLKSLLCNIKSTRAGQIEMIVFDLFLCEFIYLFFVLVFSPTMWMLYFRPKEMSNVFCCFYTLIWVHIREWNQAENGTPCILPSQSCFLICHPCHISQETTP